MPHIQGHDPRRLLGGQFNPQLAAQSGFQPRATGGGFQPQMQTLSPGAQSAFNQVQTFGGQPPAQNFQAQSFQPQSFQPQSFQPQAFQPQGGQALNQIGQFNATPRPGLAGVESLLGGNVGFGGQALAGFGGRGEQAFSQRSALAGLQGVEAEQQAINAIQQSPASQFIQEQGRREILNNAAATGGLGGGNIGRELTRFGQGVAAQRIGDRINLLGQIEQTGLTAATSGAAQENIAAQINAQRAQSLAGQRFQTGLQQSANLGATAQGLSALQSNQGRGISDITGQTGVNIANLLLNSGLNQSQIQQQEAIALANLATGKGTTLTNLALQSGGAQAAGILGQANAQAQGTSDIAGLIAAFGANQAGQQQTNSNIDASIDRAFSDPNLF